MIPPRAWVRGLRCATLAFKCAAHFVVREHKGALDNLGKQFFGNVSFGRAKPTIYFAWNKLADIDNRHIAKTEMYRSANAGFRYAAIQRFFQNWQRGLVEYF